MDDLTRTGGTIAALTGLAIAAAVLLAPSDGADGALRLLVPLVAAGLVLRIAWQDCLTFTIPDGALLALGLLAIVDRLHDPLIAFDPVLGAAVLGLEFGLAGGGVLLVREVYFRRRGHDGIGFGDVKLAAVGGLLCGLEGFAWALFAASLLGLAYALVAARRASGRSFDRLPFGAFLAPMLWGVWMWVR